LLNVLLNLLGSRAALIAENLFLRKQLALFKERKVRPQPASRSAKLTLMLLSKCFDWKESLSIVQAATFLRWHREAFCLFWRWKSRKIGRPSLPKNLKSLIRRMASENLIWGEEQIANELLLKLGIRVSPRTVNKYLRSGRPRGTSGHRWSTFVRNHAQAIVACDFFISVTATFKIVYVFVAMEVQSRKVLHFNVTGHPTSEWTIQQFRELLAFDHPYRHVIHDRDAIFSRQLDQELNGFGIRVLRTPVRAPKANAYCERLVGTLRRECLDYLIPLNEKHLKRILREYITHYNQGRPHSALGPGIPEPSRVQVPMTTHRHKLPVGYRVKAKPVINGLHHEYSLEKEVA
jgi:putative transposase